MYLNTPQHNTKYQNTLQNWHEGQNENLQESPSARNRKRCTVRSIACPREYPYPILARVGTLFLAGIYDRTFDRTNDRTGIPSTPRKDLEPEAGKGPRRGRGTPLVDRQTKWKHYLPISFGKQAVIKNSFHHDYDMVYFKTFQHCQFCSKSRSLTWFLACLCP